MESINARNYGQALRRLATLNNPVALKIAAKLLLLKDRLNFYINEQAGHTKQTALHHAKRKNNKEIYDLLIAYGADNTIPDSANKTAEWDSNQLTPQ